MVPLFEAPAGYGGNIEVDLEENDVWGLIVEAIGGDVDLGKREGVPCIFCDAP